MKFCFAVGAGQQNAVTGFDLFASDPVVRGVRDALDGRSGDSRETETTPVGGEVGRPKVFRDARPLKAQLSSCRTATRSTGSGFLSSWGQGAAPSSSLSSINLTSTITEPVRPREATNAIAISVSAGLASMIASGACKSDFGPTGNSAGIPIDLEGEVDQVIGGVARTKILDLCDAVRRDDVGKSIVERHTLKDSITDARIHALIVG